MSLLLSPVSGAPAAEGNSADRVATSWGVTVGAACLPAVAGYLAAVALLALLSAASGAPASMVDAMRAGAVGWLVAHQIPLTIDGAPLGVLPLLPTLLLGALVARGAERVGSRCGIHTPADAGWMAGTIAGTHGVLGAVLALVAIPATITVDPGLAAVGCALVAGVAAALGLARRCGLVSTALRGAPVWVRPGLMAGGWGLAILLAAGFTMVLIGLVASAPEVLQMSGSDAGSVLGLTVLSLGYLPNAAIAGLSWLAGPGFSIGALSVSPITMHAGPVPAVPLLAALPQGPVQPWWSVALVIPLLIGLAVGRRCATAAVDLAGRLKVLGVAAAALALGSTVLAALAGGRLGAATFDPVALPSGALAIALLSATLLGGGAAAMLPSPVALVPVDDAGDEAGAVEIGGEGDTERDSAEQEADPKGPVNER